MGNETAFTREQLAATRAELGMTIGALENRIRDDMHMASDSITHAVDGVTHVANSIHDSVDKTIDSVKHACDLSAHVQRRPWGTVVAAAATGFTVAILTQRSRQGNSSCPPAAFAPVFAQAKKPDAEARASESDSTDANTRGRFDRELSVVKGLAIGILAGMLRDYTARSVPAVVEGPLHDIFNAFTIRLGGQPMYGKLLARTPRQHHPMQVDTATHPETAPNESDREFA